ncbi:MAG: PAS domain-containing protein, partial [Polyangiales bacterium]
MRVLIASANPERIMLVRESLHAWPEAVVCRVAVNREDATHHVESHAPHILCWDTTLGVELPATARGICTLLLGDESCTMPEERPWAMAVPDDYVSGLQQSINREYELRRLLVQLRDAHGTETQSRLLLTRATDGIVVVDQSNQVVFANPAACALLGADSESLLAESFEYPVPEEGRQALFEARLPDGQSVKLTATAIVSIWDGREATILQLQPTQRPSAPPTAPPTAPPSLPP